MKYIDLHTHNQQAEAVYNVIVGQSKVPSKGLFSVGIHPWYVAGASFEELKDFASSERCIAIGECGLDKVCKMEFEVQLHAFMRQIELANQLKKPLIIHCVRAHNELLKIKKETKQETPWIVHGFNQKKEIGEKLIEANFYFSLGRALLIPDSNASRMIGSIAKERLFLETDGENVSIEEIGLAASALLGLPEQELLSILHQNFQHVFGNHE